MRKRETESPYRAHKRLRCTGGQGPALCPPFPSLQPHSCQSLKQGAPGWGPISMLPLIHTRHQQEKQQKRCQIYMNPEATRGKQASVLEGSLESPWSNKCELGWIRKSMCMKLHVHVCLSGCPCACMCAFDVGGGTACSCLYWFVHVCVCCLCLRVCVPGAICTMSVRMRAMPHRLTGTQGTHGEHFCKLVSVLMDWQVEWA